MFNRLRIRIKVFLKKMFSPKNSKPQFINPYQMSETVTPERPKFKDGKIVFEKSKQKPIEESKVVSEVVSVKKKDLGLVKSIADVVLSDMEMLSGITEKRERESAKKKENEEKYKQFLEIAKGEK